MTIAEYALISEFDPEQTAIYRKSLERHGIETVLVREGAAASRVLEMRGAPSLLISDLSLPQADGFSLIAELRRMSSPEHTAILVFSAHPELRAAAWNLRSTLGIAEVADKNQPPEAIARAIDRTLERITRAHPPAGAGQAENALLHKIMFRTSKAFRSPFVLLSIELRDQRRITGYLAISEVRGGSQIWPVLEHASTSHQPQVAPQASNQSPFGTGPEASALHVQAFANVPLVTTSGRAVGVLSLLDFRPQTLTAAQLALVQGAGCKIADELAAFYKADLADANESETEPPARPIGHEGVALTDRLTALASRNAGEQALDRELARARRNGGAFSLALIDLDHFKRVNDLHGHETGDEVLKQVSRILRSTFRASDFGVRWWGDEFLILLPDVPLSGARVFAERARAQVAALSVPGVEPLSLSAGVVQIQEHEDARSAIRRADAQLYDAKRAGRNRVNG